MESSYLSRFSPFKMLDRRTNLREALVHSAELINNEFPQLCEVKSCAMIGCGNGHHDLAFVHECLPNVTELTAVEPDADQMAELRTKIAQQFPTVSTDFYQETAESWSAIDKPFEAVLLFHCLYYVPLPERSAVFKKLFDKGLVSGGLVVIMISPCNVEHPYIPDKLKTTLSSSPLDIEGIQVSNMMKAVGFSDCYQMPIRWTWRKLTTTFCHYSSYLVEAGRVWKIVARQLKKSSATRKLFRMRAGLAFSESRDCANIVVHSVAISISCTVFVCCNFEIE